MKKFLALLLTLTMVLSLVAVSAVAEAVNPDDVEDNRDRKTEKKLDHGLKETFPASDPVSINPGAD